MNETIRLGRVSGVPVGIHWSVLVIGWLIAWSLAGARLPDAHPGASDGVYWLVGAVASGLFLGSLLAHELAHAVVANRFGVKVEGITLWLFGGVAQLGSEAKTAAIDFKIAVVGPATSAVASATFGVLALILDAVSGDGRNSAIVVEALAWLAVMNALLAVFNMIPAAPLDGGRILRAYLWHRSGNAARAAVTASRAGQILGYTMVSLGLLQFLSGSAAGGLWFVFLGWFVLNAAGAERQHATQQDILGDTAVSEAMTPHPVVAPDDATVQELIDSYVLRSRCSSFPLVDRTGTVSGLVTLEQIKQVPSDERSVIKAADVGRPIGEVITAAPDDLLVDLIAQLSSSPDRRALVMADGRLVGIVSPVDALRVLNARALVSSTA